MLEGKNRSELIEICSKVLKKSSMSGCEGELVAELKSIYDSIGFDEIYVDEYGSITACMKGGKPGPKVLFDAHIDTVAVDASKWKHDPFGGEIEDGKLYGRGASDMKGALSAMIMAAEIFCRNTGKDFAGDIYISGVVHEECFEGIAARKISERVKPDYVVIGEASELNLKCGQRGRAEISVETFGKPAHSANPDKGVNAVKKMLLLAGEIEKIKCPEHPVLGKGILELTDIISSPYPGASVVPDHCRVTYDRRLLVGEKPEEVLAPIKKIIEQLEAGDPDFKASVSFASAKEKCHTGNTIEGERFFPAWLFAREESFVQKVWQGLKEIGLEPAITQYSFCTNGSHYAGEAGIKTIGFGPSRENLAHTVDEYIEISQLEKACEGYMKIMEVLLGETPE